MTGIIPFFLTPQFPRFLLFSGIAALTNLGVGYLLYDVAGLSQHWHYGLAVTVAFLAGMGVSFILNRHFTFAPSGRPVRHELRTFFIVSLGGLILTVRGLRAVAGIMNKAHARPLSSFQRSMGVCGAPGPCAVEMCGWHQGTARSVQPRGSAWGCRPTVEGGAAADGTDRFRS